MKEENEQPIGEPEPPAEAPIGAQIAVLEAQLAAAWALAQREAVSLLQAGQSPRQVADALRLAYRTVARWAAQEGLGRSPGPPALQQREAARALLEGGASPAAVAEALRLRLPTVQKWARMWRLPKASPP